MLCLRSGRSAEDAWRVHGVCTARVPVPVQVRRAVCGAVCVRCACSVRAKYLRCLGHAKFPGVVADERAARKPQQRGALVHRCVGVREPFRLTIPGRCKECLVWTIAPAKTRSVQGLSGRGGPLHGYYSLWSSWSSPGSKRFGRGGRASKPWHQQDLPSARPSIRFFINTLAMRDRGLGA